MFLFDLFLKTNDFTLTDYKHRGLSDYISNNCASFYLESFEISSEFKRVKLELTTKR
jgi:cytochrome c peroxidase